MLVREGNINQTLHSESPGVFIVLLYVRHVKGTQSEHRGRSDVPQKQENNSVIPASLHLLLPWRTLRKQFVFHKSTCISVC